MKKRIVDISLIIYHIALLFVPITLYSSVSYESIFTLIYIPMLFNDYFSMPQFYVPIMFSVIYTISLITFAILLALKKNIYHSVIVPIVGFFLFSLVTTIYWSVGSNLFLGFYLSILSLAIWVVYFINQKTNFISKLKNYKRKPTNKERIAQLEKELQAIKDNQNRNA